MYRGEGRISEAILTVFSTGQSSPSSVYGGGQWLSSQSQCNIFFQQPTLYDDIDRNFYILDDVTFGISLQGILCPVNSSSNRLNIYILSSHISPVNFGNLTYCNESLSPILFFLCIRIPSGTSWDFKFLVRSFFHKFLHPP